MDDARVKSLKPRCTYTGVVLWLNDPPRYANIGQNCGVLCASGTRLAPTVVNTKHGTIRKVSLDTNIISC